VSVQRRSKRCEGRRERARARPLPELRRLGETPRLVAASRASPGSTGPSRTRLAALPSASTGMASCAIRTGRFVRARSAGGGQRDGSPAAVRSAEGAHHAKGEAPRGQGRAAYGRPSRDGVRLSAAKLGATGRCSHGAAGHCGVDARTARHSRAPSPTASPAEIARGIDAAAWRIRAVLGRP
jgi:hypothetical protein